MNDRIPNFEGEIPEHDDGNIGPVWFDSYADNLSQWAAAMGGKDVLEVACGLGILTRQLLQYLPSASRTAATDLSEDMLDYRAEILALQSGSNGGRQLPAFADVVGEKGRFT